MECTNIVTWHADKTINVGATTGFTTSGKTFAHGKQKLGSSALDIIGVTATLAVPYSRLPASL
jgi:hypothetical protein